VGRYGHDASHGHRLTVYKDLERQDCGLRPDLYILLEDVDLFGIEARVLLRIVVLLPLLYAAV
jgi:hypothetical protein